MRKKSIVMKNLKSLVSKANSGFAPRSSSKERFGLENFIAASSSEILMTRGGYDGPSWGNATNPFGASLIGSGINNSGPGGSPRQHHTSPSSGNTSSSRIPGYYNIAVKAVGEWLTPNNIIGVFTFIGGKLFSTQSTGSNADCPPGNSNPRCPNSNP
jgi:hypothetical protein